MGADSSAVANIAAALNPEALCVQLPSWEPVGSLQQWLGLQGQFLATDEEKEGNLKEWLITLAIMGPF